MILRVELHPETFLLPQDVLDAVRAPFAEAGVPLGPRLEPGNSSSSTAVPLEEAAAEGIKCRWHLLPEAREWGEEEKDFAQFLPAGTRHRKARKC